MDQKIETRIRRWWRPRPVKEPTVDEQFPELSPLQRAVESIRFFLARLERWLSGGGMLREWIRLNLRVAVVCGTGVLFGVPVISALLAGVADWSALLSLAVSNLVGMVVLLPPLVLVTAGGILLWRLGKRRWRRLHSKRPPHYQDEEDDYYR